MLPQFRGADEPPCVCAVQRGRGCLHTVPAGDSHRTLHAENILDRLTLSSGASVLCGRAPPLLSRSPPTAPRPVRGCICGGPCTTVSLGLHLRGPCLSSPGPQDPLSFALSQQLGQGIALTLLRVPLFLSFLSSLRTGPCLVSTSPSSVVQAAESEPAGLGRGGHAVCLTSSRGMPEPLAQGPTLGSRASVPHVDSHSGLFRRTRVLESSITCKNTLRTVNIYEHVRTRCGY